TPGRSPLRMAEGIARPGALDQTRQHGRFGQSNLAQILAQVHLRTLAEAMDAEATLIAQVNRIGVVVEDLLLGELLLQLHRHHGLGALAPPAALSAEPQRSRQL